MAQRKIRQPPVPPNHTYDHPALSKWCTEYGIRRVPGVRGETGNDDTFERGEFLLLHTRRFGWQIVIPGESEWVVVASHSDEASGLIDLAQHSDGSPAAS